jgi:class 3 adenylate cyclase
VELTLHSTPNDPGSAPVKLGVEVPMVFAREGFPAWAIAVIVVVVMLIVVAGAGTALRSFLANRYAPKDSSFPFGACFVSLSNIEAMQEQDPTRATAALKEFDEVVRRRASGSSVHVARRVGLAYLIVGKDIVDVSRFSAAVQSRMQALMQNKSSGFAPNNTATNDDGDAGVFACVTVHVGYGHIEHDEHSNRYEYSGPVVEQCARLSDVCRNGQILTSLAATDALRSRLGEIEGGATIEYYTNVCLDSDDAEDAEQCFTLRCSAFRNATFEPPTENEAREGNSMAAQLQQAQGGFATKMATVVLLRPVVRANNVHVPKLFQKAVEVIAATAVKHKGCLHTTHGDCLVVTFNAKTTAVGHTKKAGLAVVEMQKEIARQGRGRLRVVGALATGMITFGTVGELEMVHGPALVQAQQLLDRAVQLNFVSGPTIQSKTGGSSQMRSRRAESSNRSAGVDKHKSRSRCPSAHNSESSTEDEAMQVSVMEASTRSGSYTSTQRDGGNAYLGIFCDGSAWLDLQHTVALLVADVAVPDPSSASPTATGASRPESRVRLAVITGIRQMSEQDEWQYDLEKVQNSNDLGAQINRAFFAVAAGESASARTMIAAFDRSSPLYAAYRPVIAHLVSHAEGALRDMPQPESQIDLTSCHSSAVGSRLRPGGMRHFSIAEPNQHADSGPPPLNVPSSLSSCHQDVHV